MFNKKILTLHEVKYQSLSEKIEEEYKKCPWADNFVDKLAMWLLEEDVFNWEKSIIPKSVQCNLLAFLKKTLPCSLAPDVLAKMQGKGDTRLDLIGFLMGRALAWATFKHGKGWIPSVVELLRLWWAFSGFKSILIEDIEKDKEYSYAYHIAQQHIKWLEEHPESGIIKKEKKQFCQTCELWRKEGTLTGLWDNSFGWQYFSINRFEEIIISALLAYAPSLILPELDTIRIPTIMDSIFRDMNIQYNPDLLKMLIHDAPLCTDTDEIFFANISSDIKFPVWNGSIVAASVLSFIVDYAQVLSERQKIEQTKNTQEITDFLNTCADILITRKDGLYLVLHFMQELHHDIQYSHRDRQICILFLDAIVDAVEKQKKNILLLYWIRLEYKKRARNFLKNDLTRFLETGIQGKNQDDKMLRVLAACARLLPISDLKGKGGVILRKVYEYLFSTTDTGFYTSEYLTELPGPLHESLSWIFCSISVDNPAEKWEQSWNKLKSVRNRIFRDFLCKDMLNLMYVLNFHLVVGLAAVDCTYNEYGTECAKKFIDTLLSHLLDILKIIDRFDDFYRKLIQILMCKLYLYLNYENTNKDQQIILSELAKYLQKMYSIPMLNFEIFESLIINGLNENDIKSSKKLKNIAIKAYKSAQEHDVNNYWKINDDKKIKTICERRLLNFN